MRTIFALVLAAAALLPASSAVALKPANDDFASAATLSGMSASATRDTTDATFEQYEPWHAPVTPGGHSVWFKWTAPASGAVTIDTIGSAFDTVLSAYTGSTLTGIDSTRTQFSDDINPNVIGTDSDSRIRFGVMIGQAYRIAVDGDGAYSAGMATLHLSLDTTPPYGPANDAFASAIPLTGTNTTVQTTNAMATAEPGEAGTFGGDKKTVWYTWKPTASGGARFGTCSDRRRHKAVAVFTGATVGALTEVSSALTYFTPEEPCLWAKFKAVAGVTYRLVLDARDGDWGDGTVTIFQDTTPPNTSLDAPPAITGPTAELAFSSNEGAGDFQCRLDDGGWSYCRDPELLEHLTDGPHTFQVRAVDALGNVDPTPAQHAWTVDAAGPVMTVTSGPPAEIMSAENFSFSWTSDEPATSVECQLDQGLWELCSSPKFYGRTWIGDHVFRVRGKDEWGNLGAPGTWTFSTYEPARPVIAPAPVPTAPTANPAPAPFTAGIAMRTVSKTRVLRQKSLTVRLACSARCTGKLVVKLGRRVLARATTATTPLMTRSVRVRLGRTALSRLRRVRGSARLRLEASAVDVAARRATANTRLVLR